MFLNEMTKGDLTVLMIGGVALLFAAAQLGCSTTGTPGAAAAAVDESDDLLIGSAHAAPIVIVSQTAGDHERAAAYDLSKYITMMSGAEVDLAESEVSAARAVRGRDRVLLYVGQAALAANPRLQARLDEVAKRDPVLRADAIVVVRDGRRVYMAGTNDQSHYYAVSWLLQHWGCRWYLASEMGECVPEVDELRIGNVDVAYAPPFEARRYWISWNGSGGTYTPIS